MLISSLEIKKKEEFTKWIIIRKNWKAVLPPNPISPQGSGWELALAHWHQLSGRTGKPLKTVPWGKSPLDSGNLFQHLYSHMAPVDRNGAFRLTIIRGKRSFLAAWVHPRTHMMMLLYLECSNLNTNWLHPRTSSFPVHWLPLSYVSKIRALGKN